MLQLRERVEQLARGERDADDHADEQVLDDDRDSVAR